MSAAEMSVEWFIVEGLAEHGPIESSELKAQADKGVVTKGTKLRRGRGGKLVFAEHVDGLFAQSSQRQADKMVIEQKSSTRETDGLNDKSLFIIQQTQQAQLEEFRQALTSVIGRLDGISSTLTFIRFKNKTNLFALSCVGFGILSLAFAIISILTLNPLWVLCFLLSGLGSALIAKT